MIGVARIAGRDGSPSRPLDGSARSAIQGARSGHPQQALVGEREAFVALFDTQDQREGVNAFLEKRAPQWRNA